MLDQPQEKLFVSIKSLDNQELFSAPVHEMREDVAECFPELTNLKRNCGFEMRLPNFSAPHPCVVMVRDSKGAEWAICSAYEETPTDSIPEISAAQDIKLAYARLLGLTGNFNNYSNKNICFYIYSSDLDAGRGDTYVALGLAYRLEQLGYQIRLLPQSLWSRVPYGTGVVVAMLPDFVPIAQSRKFAGGECLQVAWIRNGLDSWLESPGLLHYDGFLCSSEASWKSIRKLVDRPCSILRLAAEHDLFCPGPGLPNHRFEVISAINHWGSRRILFDILNHIEPDFDLKLFGHLAESARKEKVARYFSPPVHYFDITRLYNSAKVNLDCFNELTRVHGNCNSRVFESLSCGLPALSNRPVHKDSILEEVQLFYDNPQSLLETVRKLLHNRGYREDLGEAGRQEVLSRHTWVFRANEFHAFLEDCLNKGRSSAKQLERRLVFYPPY